MRSIDLIRSLLANAPAAEREALAREVKEGLEQIGEMLKPKRNGNYTELGEDPVLLTEASLEEALSLMPPSTQYTLHVTRDALPHVEALCKWPEGYAKEFAPKVELAYDAAPGEWWVTNRLTNQAYGSHTGL